MQWHGNGMERNGSREDMAITAHGLKWMSSGLLVEDAFGIHPEQEARQDDYKSTNSHHGCPDCLPPL